MDGGARQRHSGMLAVLHPVFALTGIFHAIGGALLPSIAATFALNDSQSGGLFLLYFIGASVGALLCVGHRYARLISMGFILAAAASFAIAFAPLLWLRPLFLLLGIGVGVPMSAVSIVAGRMFGERSAAPLTLLNFTWSAGALVAPLFAARILVHSSYRAAYIGLAVAAILAAAACALLLRDPQPAATQSGGARTAYLHWILLFALLTFLEVGVENTTATWLATYWLRSAEGGVALAAATSSLYWIGFLTSRGLSSILLLRADPTRVLRYAVLAAFFSAASLLAFHNSYARGAAMFTLGLALAPIFPLLLARFFAKARNASDSRWVLATCGFGGSVLPWLTGVVSSQAHSLRVGLAVVPAALLLIALALPLLGPAALRTADS